jgi:hypothetical protein
MNAIRIITAGYRALTQLYPREYRTEFGVELRGVFASMVEQAAECGRLSLAAICLRELRDLPVHLAREHFDNLRKDIAMKAPLFSSPSTYFTSTGGSIGFGIGFALVVLLRTLVDPANSMLMEDFGNGLAREISLFALAGALGGTSIAIVSRSPRKIRAMAMVGALSCGLSAGLGTVCKYVIYRLGLWDSGALAGSLLSLAVAALMGAVMGVALGTGRQDRHHIAYPALLGAAGFVIAYALAFLVSRPMLQHAWPTPYWQLPHALSALILGLLGGAVLGWAAGRHQINSLNAKTI